MDFNTLFQDINTFRTKWMELEEENKSLKLSLKNTQDKMTQLEAKLAISTKTAIGAIQEKEILEMVIEKLYAEVVLDNPLSKKIDELDRTVASLSKAIKLTTSKINANTSQDVSSDHGSGEENFSDSDVTDDLHIEEISLEGFHDVDLTRSSIERLITPEDKNSTASGSLLPKHGAGDESSESVGPSMNEDDVRGPKKVKVVSSTNLRIGREISEIGIKDIAIVDDSSADSRDEYGIDRDVVSNSSSLDSANGRRSSLIPVVQNNPTDFSPQSTTHDQQNHTEVTLENRDNLSNINESITQLKISSKTTQDVDVNNAMFEFTDEQKPPSGYNLREKKIIRESRHIDSSSNQSGTPTYPKSKSNPRRPSYRYYRYRKCLICVAEGQKNFRFKSTRVLEKHIFENHSTPDSTYLCCPFMNNKCRKYFTNRANLRNHILMHHPQIGVEKN